jgi:lysophospholipase L1-like esterase
MNLIKNIVLLFVSLVVAVKAADLMLEVLQPENTFGVRDRGIERSIILKEINPNYHAMLTPSENYLKSKDSLQRQQYLVRTDSNGFIHNGNENIDTNDDVKKIVFLGGSTTEQIFVSENKRWQSVLERNLNSSHLRRTYKVINGGVSGNHTLHSTLNLIAKVIPLKPDYVVLMHNINDLGVLRETGSYWNAPQNRSLVQVQNMRFFYIIAREIKDLLMPNIYLLVNNLRTGNDEFAEFRMQKNFGIDVIEDEFRRALITFLDVSRAWDIEPILMTQFNRINVNDDLFIRTFSDKDAEIYVTKYHRLNEIIRNVGLTHKVDVIDLAELLPSSNAYMYDAVHLNEKGSEFVANILSNYWLEKLSQTKSTPQSR